MQNDDQNTIQDANQAIEDQNLDETPVQADEQPQPEADHPLDSEEAIENQSEGQTENIATEPVGEAEEKSQESTAADEISEDISEKQEEPQEQLPLTGPRPRWYVVHTYSGHENKVATALKQRIESEHLENKIIEVLVPTQDKIEIRGGKKETVKEKIFPGYILVKMLLDDNSWLAVRTTQGVTSFIGMSSKPTPIPDAEVQSIVSYMQQGGQPTYKQVFSEGDTVKIIDGPFAEFIGKVETVDKEKGKVRILVSIFGRETPVELDFLQVAKL